MTLSLEHLDDNIRPPVSQIFESVLEEIKIHGGNKNKMDVEPFRIKGNLWLLELRRYNRLSQMRNKQVKDITCDYKLKVDQNYLILQNLLYQVNYLKQEIKKCYDYQTQYEDIYWIPLQQFLKIKPEFSEVHVKLEKFNDPEQGKASEENKIEAEHKLMIARLEWELEQRKSLNDKYVDMLKKKIIMENDIKDKRKLLASVYPALCDALKASQPLQKLFGLDFEKDHLYADMIYTMPTPLYLVYTRCQAYKNLFSDNDVNLEIIQSDGDGSNDTLEFFRILKEDIVKSYITNTIINVPQHSMMDTADDLNVHNDLRTGPESYDGEVVDLNYEYEETEVVEPRTALSLNERVYKPLSSHNKFYELALDTSYDLTTYLTASKYSLKLTIPLTAQRFRSSNAHVQPDSLENGSLKVEFLILYYPHLDSVTIKSVVLGGSSESQTLWDTLMGRSILNHLDLKERSIVPKSRVGGFGNVIYAPYYLPKLVDAIVRNYELEPLQITTKNTIIDKCLHAIYGQIGYPFEWLQSLAGIVNEPELKNSTMPSSFNNYSSIYIIKDVIDSVVQRLASRLHIVDLVNHLDRLINAELEAQDHKIGDLKITSISHTPGPDQFLPLPIIHKSDNLTTNEGRDSLLTSLDIVMRYQLQPKCWLEVHVTIGIPVNCDYCYHYYFHEERILKSSQGFRAPIVSFSSHSLVYAEPQSSSNRSNINKAKVNRQKLTDMQTSAKLYKEFKGLELDINKSNNMTLWEPADVERPCIIAKQLAAVFKGVDRIGRDLVENADSDETKIVKSHHHVTRLLSGFLDRLKEPLEQEDSRVWTDFKTIFE